ncbi:PRC-barrel domain-containing protein [Phreatobacter oligotrophus]|uniref:PRC-barrel domain protein n=1 Tax=Phreatobacter oligotrophus TaxID=1122261 RepID=A0A2T4YYN3_9HYPH|nr:PRC-barrel domain-containing protein [Phreatobacter oligotrophus]PTM51831.1 PRC-barrel domain protein [Phreatobacter oligotrophus]
MFRKHLVTASVATLLATGALAQTNTPNTTTTPGAQTPAQTAPATPSTRAQQMTNEQLTANKIIGISIYAPKPDAPATTGSTVTPNRNAAAPNAGGSSTGTPMGSTSGSTAMPGSGTATTTSGMTPGPGSMAITPVSDEQWRMMRDRHDSIGKVDDLAIGNDGRVSHAILGVGGFLGIGEKNVAIPLSDVKFMRMSDGTLVGFVTSTKQQLQDMPTFVRSRT